MNYKKTSPAIPDAAERRRSFTDSEGTLWEVREVAAPAYDRRSTQCLIFDSVNVIRRVRNYPADWFDATDAELAALSWGN